MVQMPEIFYRLRTSAHATLVVLLCMTVGCDTDDRLLRDIEATNAAESVGQDDETVAQYADKQVINAAFLVTETVQDSALMPYIYMFVHVKYPTTTT